MGGQAPRFAWSAFEAIAAKRRAPCAAPRLGAGEVARHGGGAVSKVKARAAQTEC